MAVKKYLIESCTGIKEEYTNLHELIDILSDHESSKLSSKEICLLSAGIDIEKKDKNNKFMYSIKVLPI